jgi:hypothetical protein
VDQINTVPDWIDEAVESRTVYEGRVMFGEVILVVIPTRDVTPAGR